MFILSHQSFGILWWSIHSFNHSFWGIESCLWRIHIPLILFLFSQTLCSWGRSILGLFKTHHWFSSPSHPAPSFCSQNAFAWPEAVIWPFGPYPWVEVFRELINAQKSWQWCHGSVYSDQRAWKHLEITFFRTINRLTSRNEGFYSLNSSTYSLCSFLLFTK